MGDYDINADPDDAYVQNLNGRTYMAGMSPVLSVALWVQHLQQKLHLPRRSLAVCKTLGTAYPKPHVSRYRAGHHLE